MTTTTTGPIGRLAIQGLRARFRGALLRPGEEGYDEARRIWNGRIDRHPALIARCAGADDVLEAVRFARERDLLVSVRGGGHAVAGQPARRRARDRRRGAVARRRAQPSRAVLGPAWRWWQLRHRHRLRVPAAPGRAARAGRADVLAAGGRAQGAAPAARPRARRPDELGITLGIMVAPPAPFMPPDQIGRPVVGLILIWTGDPADGERVIAPLRRVATPVADALGAMPYLALQSMLDAGAPHGRHYYWRSHRLPVLSDPVIDALVAGGESMTSPFSQLNGWAMGGAVSRVDPGATAVGEREAGFDIGIAAGWPPDDRDADRHVAWVRQVWKALRPHSAGVYVNFLSDEGRAGLDAAYGGRLERLTALKDRYDPTNLFRLNANIPPSRPVAR